MKVEKQKMKDVGITQWFRFGRRDEVDLTINLLRDLGVRRLRTAISWADWERPESIAWFDWMITSLHGAGIEIFPSFFYTPAGRARLLPHQTIEQAATSFPPARLADYADFCNEVLIRYGDKLGEWCQIWNEPNNDAYWSPAHDPDHSYFAEMADLAAAIFHARGKKVVLGGIIPPYVEWIRRMRLRGILDRVDAIGIHAFPGTWDKMVWKGWAFAVDLVREAAGGQQVWITETGFSTVTLDDQGRERQRFREREQIDYFNKVLQAPAERAYWFCAIDQDPGHLTDNALVRGTAADPRAYYFGLADRSGRHKPLFVHWQKLLNGSRLKQRPGKELEAA